MGPDRQNSSGNSRRRLECLVSLTAPHRLIRCSNTVIPRLAVRGERAISPPAKSRPAARAQGFRIPLQSACRSPKCGPRVPTTDIYGPPCAGCAAFQFSLDFLAGCAPDELWRFVVARAKANACAVLDCSGESPGPGAAGPRRTRCRTTLSAPNCPGLSHVSFAVISPPAWWTAPATTRIRTAS